MLFFRLLSAASMRQQRRLRRRSRPQKSHHLSKPQRSREASQDTTSPKARQASGGELSGGQACHIVKQMPVI